MVGVFKFLMALFIIYSVIRTIAHISKDDEKNTVGMSFALLGLFMSGLISLMHLAY